MWRLRIGEGGNDPYIYSTNNYLGRQTWEFDPNAGTPEDRAEVEQARQNFYNNRNYVQASSDLIWQMQFLREKKFKQTIAEQRLRMVMTLYITGHLNTIFSGEYSKEILRYIYCHQNENGGWGLYVGGHSTMFSTALNYICMRLLGVGPDGGLNNACKRGRKWILDRGGVTTIPSWGKTWLAILGVYEWSGCHPMPPEFWLFPSYFPIHPAKMFCLLRGTYMPTSYLYGKKFVGPITPLISQLRQELHIEPYDEINWRKKLHLCAKEDLHYPHSLLQRLLWDCLYMFSEPLLNSWPFNKFREKALRLRLVGGIQVYLGKVEFGVKHYSSRNCWERENSTIPPEIREINSPSKSVNCYYSGIQLAVGIQDSANQTWEIGGKLNSGLGES
ncbi:hypothetical protein PTKIN_Ptkin07bG0040100 [Pterospermum kingtungense]